MNPVLGAAAVAKIATQFSQYYKPGKMVAEVIMPRLKVVQKTGKFAKYGKENLRSYSSQIYRAPGTRAHSVDYSVSQGTYVCTEKSLEKRIPDEMAANSDDPYQPSRDATAVIMDNIAINMELALATTMQSTAVITQNTTLTGNDQWSDYTNSDPLGDIETAIDTVRTATAQRPNVMVIGYSSFRILKNHPDVREQLKYTNGGQPSDDQMVVFLKSYFRLEEVIIGEGSYNQAVEGQADSLADIWGDNCWLLFRNPTLTLMQATFGLTLSDVPRVADSYREDETISNIVRVRDSFDQTICDAALCYLIKDTNA